MGRRPDTKELVRRAKMWAQGMSIIEIARECCVTEHTIECYTRKHRDMFPYRHTTSTHPERETARRMRSEGMTYAEIARELGRHMSTIFRWCSDDGEK